MSASDQPPTEAAQGAAENSFTTLSDQQEEKPSPPRKKDIQLRRALPVAHSRSPWGKAAHSLSTDTGGPVCHGMPTPWNSPTSMLRLYNVLFTITTKQLGFPVLMMHPKWVRALHMSPH